MVTSSGIEGVLSMTDRWEPGDGALHVALGNAATSFGRERIPAHEAVAVLRALAKGQLDLLLEVAVIKLRAHRGRGFADQLVEMYAAACLLMASTNASVPTSGGSIGV
jgi:hypothetical protein